MLGGLLACGCSGFKASVLKDPSLGWGGSGGGQAVEGMLLPVCSNSCSALFVSCTQAEPGSQPRRGGSDTPPASALDLSQVRLERVAKTLSHDSRALGNGSITSFHLPRVKDQYWTSPALPQADFHDIIVLGKQV